MALTEQGKAVALEGLRTRRATSPPKLDNAALPAGSPMFFYCLACGYVSDQKPELYVTEVKKLCAECAALKACGWLE